MNKIGVIKIMKLKAGDKVKILWEKAPYISEYEDIGEVHSMDKGRYIVVTVYRKFPKGIHSRLLRFLPRELVPIAEKTQNGDTL